MPSSESQPRREEIARIGQERPAGSDGAAHDLHSGSSTPSPQQSEHFRYVPADEQARHDHRRGDKKHLLPERLRVLLLILRLWLGKEVEQQFGEGGLDAEDPHDSGDHAEECVGDPGNRPEEDEPDGREQSVEPVDDPIALPLASKTKKVDRGKKPAGIWRTVGERWVCVLLMGGEWHSLDTGRDFGPEA